MKTIIPLIDLLLVAIYSVVDNYSKKKGLRPLSTDATQWGK
jgi:hypothetical protein